MRPYFVYKITHRDTGRLYFGITRNDPGRRLKQHYNDIRGDRVITRAMRKHGLSAFDLEVVEELASEAGAREREIYFIAMFDTTNRANGFNVSPGGDYDCRWWDYATDEQREAFSANSSDVLQKWWDAQTPEARAARGGAISRGIAALPPAERERRAETAREIGRRFWEEATPEQIDEFREAASKAQSRRWANATDEERERVGDVFSKAWWARPAEERERMVSKRVRTRKDNFAALPPEAQAAIRDELRARAERSWGDPGIRAARISKRNATMAAKTTEEKAASAALGWLNMSPKGRSQRVANISKAQKAFTEANPEAAQSRAERMREVKAQKKAEADKLLSPKELHERKMARERNRRYLEKKRAARKAPDGGE